MLFLVRMLRLVMTALAIEFIGSNSRRNRQPGTQKGSRGSAKGELITDLVLSGQIQAFSFNGNPAPTIRTDAAKSVKDKDSLLTHA
jgi:hypothetical protein